MRNYRMTVNVQWAEIMKILRWSIGCEYRYFAGHFEDLRDSVDYGYPDRVKFHLPICKDSVSLILEEIEIYNSLRRFLGYKIADTSSLGLPLVDVFLSDFGGVAE